MRITVKSIIKWGLIAEIITAIVGQAGEFALRYRSYSSAFDELFGRYRLQTPNEEFELDPRAVTRPTAALKQAPLQVDPNHQRYDHRSGRNLPFANGSLVSDLMISSTETSMTEPVALQSVGNSTDKSHLFTIVESIFGPSITVKSKSDSSLFNFDSYSSSVSDMLSMPRSVDPRPMLVCAILVCLNILFIIGIVYEYLPLICPLTIVWLLYLILVLLILHAGATDTGGSSSVNLVAQSPWTTLTPSPFTILVVSIILVFSLILTAMIVEERRQVAIRIRAKSAAIPLVKSRDMDLDEI